MENLVLIKGIYVFDFRLLILFCGVLGRFCWFLFIIFWLRECDCESIWFVGCGVSCFEGVGNVCCCDSWLKIGGVWFLFSVDDGIWFIVDCFWSCESVCVWLSCRCIWLLGKDGVLLLEVVVLLLFFDWVCVEFWFCGWIRFGDDIWVCCNWLCNGFVFLEWVCVFLDRCNGLGGCIWLLYVGFVCVNLKFWVFIWFCDCDCKWFENCVIFDVFGFLWIWFIVLGWSWLSRWFWSWEIFGCLFVSIICLLECFVICFCCCCK